MEDYELLKDNEGYLYDLTDLLRQAIANSAAQYYQDFTAAFEAGNKEVFDQKAQAFLDLIDLQDRVLNTNENFMVGYVAERVPQRQLKDKMSSPR